MTSDARRLLVMAIEPVPDEVLKERLHALGTPAEAEVQVVSPASKVSRLQWLANEEDTARDRAEHVAEKAAGALDGEAASAEASVGDVDPLQAAEDALRTFDADELLVVVRDADHATWLERASMEEGFERFGRPVTYVVVRGRGESSRP